MAENMRHTIPPDSLFAPRRLRLLAKLVDMSLASALTLMFTAGLGLSGEWEGTFFCCVFLSLDLIQLGKSPGKSLCGIVVVRERELSACSRWQAVCRNLPFLTLPFLDWSLIAGAKRQRLGDYLCDTLVVSVSHLQVASPEISGDAAVTMNLQTVAVFGTMLEAEILCARLNASGIPAVVVDGNLVQACALIAIAVGGVRVQVLGEDVPRAKDLVTVWEQGGLTIEAGDM